MLYSWFQLVFVNIGSFLRVIVYLLRVAAGKFFHHLLKHIPVGFVPLQERFRMPEKPKPQLVPCLEGAFVSLVDASYRVVLRAVISYDIEFHVVIRMAQLFLPSQASLPQILDGLKKSLNIRPPKPACGRAPLHCRRYFPRKLEP